MDKEAVRFATREVNRALRHVEARGIVSLTDGEALHDLRILYKRLRYLAEGFRPLLALEQAELAHHAAKFQKVLGDIHDLDVARAAVIADESLAPEIRGPIQQAVEAERTQQAIEFALRRARVVAEAELLGLAPHAPPEEKRPAPGAASKSS
jgi:CHAD domain-containing protein